MKQNRLIITNKVLTNDQTWSSMIETACEIVGIEYTNDIRVSVTFEFSENMTLMPDGTVDFSKIDTYDLLEAIDKKTEVDDIPTSLVASRLIEEDVDLKSRIEVLCASIDKPYSKTLLINVCNVLSRNEKASIVIKPNYISTLEIDDDKLKSVVTTQADRLNAKEEPTEEEEEPNDE